jgi:integrase
MLKIIFYIKSDKVNAKGECPIFAQITLNDQKATIATGKRVTPDRWNFTNNLRNVLKLEKEKVLKHALELIHLQIERTYNGLAKQSSKVDLADLKLELQGKTKSKTDGPSILSLFDKHNQMFKRKVEHGERSAASLQKYLRAKEHIRAFIKKTYKNEELGVGKITSAFIYNLESYLKYESEHHGKTGIQNNAVVKYFSNFKSVFNHALKMDLVDKNPFIKYEGKTIVQEATFLSQEELNLIEQKIFTIGRLDKVKDIFLFSCYTGYAPVDASALTSHNIVKDGNGDEWIKTDRAKTGTRANVPILPPAKRIIVKYAGQQAGLIPHLSNQKMNAYLKEIGAICGINKHLTWYVARHTFATTITLGNGVKIENVSAMMGHTTIRQTQHYAKVLDVNIKEDMALLSQKFK